MAYKPPFFHWSIAAVSAVVNGGQVTEMTSRLPSAIALIAMTLCGFLFFAKRKGVQLALLAAFITLTNNSQKALFEVNVFIFSYD